MIFRTQNVGFGRFHRTCGIAVYLGLVASTVAMARDPLVLHHRWEIEPDLGASWYNVVPQNPVLLDTKHFTAPGQQASIDEAQKALLHASRLDGADRAETLRVIIEQLAVGKENRQVTLALASAAIKLSDGSEANELWSLLREDVTTRNVVEHALIRWKSTAALDTWRSRLAHPNATTTELLTALSGIEAMGDRSDRTALEGLLLSNRISVPAKVAAARALGTVVTQGLEPLAEATLAAKVEQRELIAAHLLAKHAGERTQMLLKEIIDGSNVPAQSRAFASMVASDLQQARIVAQLMISHRDSNLRLQAIDVLNLYDDETSLREQAIALADINLNVRSTVRENLEHKAQNESLRTTVDEILSHHLTGERYEGIEQAILLAVALGDAECCPQLVALLAHPRPEVNTRAAWALQELATAPEVLDSILPYTLNITDRLVNAQGVENTEVIQAAYLFQVFGRNRYQPATKMLNLYIPKSEKMGVITRTAAIWALGRIFEGSKDATLAKLLVQRFLDNQPLNPEAEPVKYVSAIALGYIGEPTSPEHLRKTDVRPPFPVGLAKQWAIEQFPTTDR